MLIKPLRSGQITIPASFRKRLGIGRHSILQVNLVEGELHIKPLKVSDTAGNNHWFKKLSDQFCDVRSKNASFSENEINATIDKAVQIVRKSHA